MADGKLRGKVALVTGASRTVGKGIAYRLASEGAHVLVNGRHLEAIEPLVADWRASGLSVEAAVADVSDPAAIDGLIRAAAAGHGSLDILVNNAVVHVEKGERGPFFEVKAAGWREFMARNLDALFFTTRAAARIMGKQRRGSIINISSNGAVQAHRRRIAYDAFKGALEAFTRAVAIDLAPWNIRVNVLRPCAVWEEQEPGTPKHELEVRLGGMIPLGRIARPEDVARAAVFLACEDSAFITGQCINIDGGMLSQSRPPELELEPVAGPEDIPL